MGANHRLRLLAALVLTLVCARRASAADPENTTHIRPLAGIDAFVAEGQRRSQTIRSLVARIEQSDLVVYIRARPFNSPATTGHMQFVGATPGRRYVMIEIACGESWNVRLATLGHELRHAVEVAEAPWVQSAGDVEAHYSRIGFVSGYDSFETDGAADAGRQVARELLGNGGAPVMIATRDVR